MKTIKIALLGAVVVLAFMFTGSTAARAETPGRPSMQIVPKTKHYSRKTYNKGRWVTQTTWRHGKRYSKKVWYTGNRWGHKTGRKTKEVVMGKKKRTP
jgi:hypothetical protein